MKKRQKLPAIVTDSLYCEHPYAARTAEIALVVGCFPQTNQLALMTVQQRGCITSGRKSVPVGNAALNALFMDKSLLALPVITELQRVHALILLAQHSGL